MQRFVWVLSVVGSLVLAPELLFACWDRGPVFTNVGSQTIYVSGSNTKITTFTVGARDVSPACSTAPLGMTVVGIPSTIGGTISSRLLQPRSGEAAIEVTVQGYAPAGTYNLTYKVTDGDGNTQTVTAPIFTGGSASNPPPTLDPVGDLQLIVGELKSFTIGATDTNLIATGSGLVIDGLPPSSEVTYTRISSNQIAARVDVKPGANERGTYLVHITARDTTNGWSKAQMRIFVY